MKLRVGVATVAVLALLPSGSASAATVKEGAFLATVTLGGPLGYPCASEVGSVECLASVPTGGQGGSGPVSFTLSATACGEATAGGLGVAGPKRDGVSSCTITANGSLWGSCGLATGAGVLTLSNLGPIPGAKPNTTFAITVTDTGGLWRIAGRAGDTVFSAEALAVATSGTCATASATRFAVAGHFSTTAPL